MLPFTTTQAARLEEGLACFRAAVALAPSRGGAYQNYATALYASLPLLEASAQRPNAAVAYSAALRSAVKARNHTRSTSVSPPNRNPYPTALTLASPALASSNHGLNATALGLGREAYSPKLHPNLAGVQARDPAGTAPRRAIQELSQDAAG